MKYPITAAEILSVAGLLLALAAIVYLTVRIISAADKTSRFSIH
jgi:hypothetical protein